MINVSEIAERIEQIAKARRDNGSSTQQASIEYSCQTCHDNGVVAVLVGSDERVPVGDMRMLSQRHNIVPCNCMEQKRIERLFRSSHITDSFRNVGFKDFVVDGRPACVKRARDNAIDYYKRFDDLRDTDHNSIILHGIPGSGKTHLLMAVANGLMRKGVAVQYFPWVEGFNDLKGKLDELQQRTEAMKRVEVLFLDDLYKGRQKPTDFMLEQLFGVVNYRYLNHLPMMVSSERTVEEMFDIDEGIARRIHERSEGHRVLMTLAPDEREMELNFSLRGDV